MLTDPKVKAEVMEEFKETFASSDTNGDKLLSEDEFPTYV